jgi:hypothetical protein
MREGGSMQAEVDRRHETDDSDCGDRADGF